MAAFPSLSRRKFLSWSMAGALGLSLPQWLALQASANERGGRARNVLVILEQGGLSHMDTWDPKPEAPADHRSPYRPIATTVPGMRFTELMPRTAQLAHKLSVVRSMVHARGGANDHPRGTRYVLSGMHPANPLEFPDLGSVAVNRLGTANRALPPYVMVPGNHEQAAEARSGFLPASTRPFKTGGRDLSDPAWRVGALLPREENQGARINTRQHLLHQVDSHLMGGGRMPVAGIDSYFEQAFATLTSPEVTRAFDLRNEPDRVRAKYGAGHRGACYLVGRKLIEAGVRFVTVDVRWPLTGETPMGSNLNWDHHDHIYARGTCNLPGASGAGAGRYGIGHWSMMGSTDHAFAALIDDMDQRGLLAETLVCFVTEFGRTPRLNQYQGRDHWTDAYSIAMAGAGTPGGQVIGSSDREGGRVVSDPHTPEDYAATVYAKLGIDRAAPLYTSSNRPVYLHDGEPIREMF